MNNLLLLFFAVLPFAFSFAQDYVVFDSIGNNIEYATDYNSGKKTLYVRHNGEVKLMTPELFSYTIRQSPWAESNYDRSLKSANWASTSASVSLITFGLTAITSGAAERVGLNFSSKFGTILLVSSGAIITAGLTSWAISKIVHKIQRRRYIKISNLGLQQPLWKF